MKRIFPIFIISLTVAIICSCSEELYPEKHYSLDEGELTECTLGLSVGDFQVTSGSDSRADNVTTTATDAEKKINDIWVFQYDESGNLLIKPRYYLWESATIVEGADGYKSKWPVVLKKNVSTIYVVANTGSSTWAENYQDFNTLTLLKAQNLPSAEPIQVGDGTNMVTAEDVILPMSGFTKVSNVNDIAQVEVKVQRMYAKVIISAKMLASMKLDAIEVSNILKTCRVQSRSYGDDGTDATDENTAATYPDDVQTDLLTYNTTNDVTTSSTENNVKYATTAKDYIIYAPENIQGVSTDVGSQTQKGKDYDKDGALCIEFSLQVPKNSSDENTSYIACTAKVYPGGNIYNNFNVKRNRIYNVVAEFPSIEYFFPTPSSNCFVVKPNSSITFWPYVRKETGGGYKISDYITPDEDSKTIKGVKIIWQDKDVIGNNSAGKLVTLDTPTTIPETDKTEYIRKNTTITVKTNAEGNALIGAYNNADCTGDVLWSWHIWVTDNHPDNVGNAIRYTTYRWDSSKIYTDEARVPGYQVMPCNLGAKEFEPTSSVTATYGPLYQWGRKDPFPSMKVSGKAGGIPNYSNSGSNIYVYDNSNRLITMSTNGSAEKSKDTELFRTVKYDKTYVDGFADGLKYSIRNPTTFISATKCELTNDAGSYNNINNYTNNGDWLLGHDDQLWGGEKPTSSTTHYKVNMQYAGMNVADDQIPYVWDNYGSEKTIFDPCPSGWRVPPSDLWMGYTSTGESVHQSKKNFNTFFLPKVNTTDTDSKIYSNNGFYMYLDGWKTGSTTFFPTPGLRMASGQPISCNICGNYHNATSAPMIDTGGKYGDKGAIYYNDRVNCLHFHSSSPYNQVNVFESQRLFVYKAIAGPIRCVRDKK